MNNQPILLMDSMNIFVRHFCANPAMDTNGEQSGGIIGTLKSVSHLIREISPSKVIFCWESGGSLRRRTIFSEYKAGRKPLRTNRTYETIPDTEENKWVQISTLTKLLKYLPVFQIHLQDAEADDTIGYICKYKYPDNKKIIVSSDKDMYQLLDNNTIIYKPGKMEYVNKRMITEEFNITPENFCVAKAFCGDPSDNIPGIDGVGFKTLAKRFKLNEDKISVDDLINESEIRSKEKKPLKLYQAIVDGQEIIKRNYKIMKLDASLLSIDQVSSINRILDEYKPKSNKLKFIQTFLSKNLTGLDPDVIYGIFDYLVYLN